MSDTPDVLDAPRDLMRAARIVRSSSWPIDMAASMEALADRLDWLADHLGAGYVLVKADGLSHGDELVQVGWAYRQLHKPLRAHLCADEPKAHPLRYPVFAVRRSVPENGE